MKKKAQFPSRDALRALYPPETGDYMRAIRGTLADLTEKREVRPVMKRKMTFAVALAAALTLALTATALAAGMGAFGKIARLWESRGEAAYMATLDEKSEALGVTRTLPAAGAYPSIRLTLSQAYYDGEAFSFSYEAEGLGSVSDYGWRPTAEELAALEETGVFGLTGEEGLDLDPAFVQAMVETARREGCAGAAVYSTYLGDGVTLAGTDVYLDLSMSEDAGLEEGRFVGMREFASPLPQQARDQDELAIDVTVYRSVEWHYYDGKTWYFGWDFAGRTANALTFTVPRMAREAASAISVTRAFDGYEVEAELTVTPVKFELTLTTSGRRLMAAVWEEAKPGDLLDYEIAVDGERAKMIAAEGGLLPDGRTQLRYEFALPQGTPGRVTLVPQYVAEGDEIAARPGESVEIVIK